MAQEHERRTFFRIRDRLVIEFRQLAPEDFTQLKDVIQHNSTQILEDAGETCFLTGKNLKGEHGELYTYVLMMNKKLDMIIDTLSKPRQNENYHNIQTEVSLSGAGVRFESHVSLSAGDYAEVKMIIPVFPYPKITVLCQVMRTERSQGDATCSFRTAMKFLVISEKDRDFLIRYIFEKERELLRQKKETAG